MTADRLFFVGPFEAKESTTITRLGTSVSTGTGTGGDTAILGIYTDNNGIPEDLVGTNNAEVAIDVATQVEATVSIDLVAGKKYWMAINCEANVTLEGFANSGNVRDTGGETYNGTSSLIKDTYTYASPLPATAPSVLSDYTNETQPMIWFREV
jgi:hypothetical protein